MQAIRQSSCARCGQVTAYSGDWYGDLCPECADKTAGDWSCRSCGRHGSFEEMGGNGVTNPVCCAVPCQHLGSDELASDTDAEHAPATEAVP